MVRVGSDIFRRWRRVFLGHYHAAQKMDESVEYVGSPLQLSFGEADQKKHIVVYDTLTDSSEYIENDFSPRHIIVDEEHVATSELRGHFVRLEVENLSSSHINKIRDGLVNEMGVSTLEIKQRPVNESHVIADAKSIIKNEDEMIERYVEQAAPDGLDRDTLIKIGTEICRSAANS
jgi:DNA repair exonuclease SbcCD nuclease subunit